MQERLRDPLTEVTRKERRMLLGASTVGLAVAITGAVPTRIAALGIDFNATNQSGFLIVLIGVILYFHLAFSAYGWTDYATWRLTVDSAKNEIKSQEIYEDIYPRSYHEISSNSELVESEIEDSTEVFVQQCLKWSWCSTSRVFFEFAVPFIISVSAIVMLVYRLLQ